MRRPLTLFLSSVLLTLPVAATEPRAVIGTAVSSGGAFQVAHTPASGTATIFSGDEIQTGTGASKIMLKSGSQLDLLPHSSAAVFSGHATLEDGTLHTHLSGSFYVASSKFTVKPDTPQTEATLQTVSGSLTVSVLAGSADVLALDGTRVAHMNSGGTLNFGSFDAPTTTPNEARLMGVLDSENGHLLLRDRYSGTVSELVGPISPKYVNKFVMVDGNVVTNRTSSVSQVDRVVQVNKFALSDATTAIPCAADGAGGVAAIIKLAGALNKVRNHFLLEDKGKNKTYELVGDVDDKQVGTDVKVRGFILPKRQALLPAEQVVYTEARDFALYSSPCAGLIIGSTLVTSGIALRPGSDAGAVATSRTVPISY